MRRTIFLVDMNAYYITCEMSRRPELWSNPAVVAGDPLKRTGIILAANYNARAYGIKTAMTLREALKLCPELITVPPDHSFYSHKSREVMTLLADYSPCIEQNSIDEAWLDMTGTEALFGNPVQAAGKIMDDLKEKLSLWCSIGISENKFLAKMASDMKKPLGITVLWPEELAEKLWPMPVSNMYGIGQKTSHKLNQLQIFTIKDLALADTGMLVSKLGDHALELQQRANGKDNSPVTPHLREDMKSIGRSTTLAEDAYKARDVRMTVMALAEDVGRRARKYGKFGHTIHIDLKFSDFTAITRQISLPEPTQYTQDIFETGYALIKKHWPTAKGVRLIGISLSGFEPKEKTCQLSIFDLPQHTGSGSSLKEKHKIIDEVMDEIRRKHGANKVARASLLKHDTRKD
jgi:DNA polymerase IV